MQQHSRVQLLQLVLELRYRSVPVDRRRGVLPEGQQEGAVIRLALDLLDLVDCMRHNAADECAADSAHYQS
jgi:hypothetical protein